MDEEKQNRSQSKIFILTPDHEMSVGGIRSNYRVVDILNRNGFRAYILHWKKSFAVREINPPHV